MCFSFTRTDGKWHIRMPLSVHPCAGALLASPRRARGERREGDTERKPSLNSSHCGSAATSTPSRHRSSSFAGDPAFAFASPRPAVPASPACEPVSEPGLAESSVRHPLLPRPLGPRRPHRPHLSETRLHSLRGKLLVATHATQKASHNSYIYSNLPELHLRRRRVPAVYLLPRPAPRALQAAPRTRLCASRARCR
jgi:hypothetical protein